ncbi:MAG: hypothetical protein ACPG47_04565 [Leucothrix sp.]
MSFKPSAFPGGHERHCLRRIRHAEIFSTALQTPETLLADAIRQDNSYEAIFLQQFEAVLARAVALKPSEATDVVLAVKAELDRLYTVSKSVCGDQAHTQAGLSQLIELTMQSVKRAAGNDPLAIKELQEEDEARHLHFKLLECDLVADLLNSHSQARAFIPNDELIPTLLSTDKATLADAVQLFDLQQAVSLVEQAEQYVQQLNDGQVSAIATQNLKFIRGYGVYLDAI